MKTRLLDWLKCFSMGVYVLKTDVIKLNFLNFYMTETMHFVSLKFVQIAHNNY